MKRESEKEVESSQAKKKKKYPGGIFYTVKYKSILKIKYTYDIYLLY